MRWLNANGINARGFFNLFTKQPNRTFPNQIAFGNAGVLMVGMFLQPTGELKTAARFSALFESLATKKDNLVSINKAEFSSAAYLGGRFVAFDFDGNVYESTNGVDFTLGINPNTDYPSPVGLAYDSKNNTIVFSGSRDASSVYVSVNTTPLDFTTVVEVDPAFLGAVGAWPEEGILLAAGGGTNPNMWRSTDGGFTWTQVGDQPFLNCGQFLQFGMVNWVLQGSTGTANVQYSVSRNNGDTWSAATNFPGPSNSAVVAAMATDRETSWVAIGDSEPPDNYWVSDTDGNSWTSPNLFGADKQDGGLPGLLCWNPVTSKWCACWSDPSDSFLFVATSDDGTNWDVGPEIIDQP